jgi:hypothetical protein
MFYLCSNLVSALASLNVNDFSHFDVYEVSGVFKRRKKIRSNSMFDVDVVVDVVVVGDSASLVRLTDCRPTLRL